MVLREVAERMAGAEEWKVVEATLAHRGEVIEETSAWPNLVQH
jgi:hypothetical protein